MALGLYGQGVQAGPYAELTMGSPEYNEHMFRRQMAGVKSDRDLRMLELMMGREERSQLAKEREAERTYRQSRDGVGDQRFETERGDKLSTLIREGAYRDNRDRVGDTERERAYGDSRTDTDRKFKIEEGDAAARRKAAENAAALNAAQIAEMNARTGKIGEKTIQQRIEEQIFKPLLDEPGMNTTTPPAPNAPPPLLARPKAESVYTPGGSAAAAPMSTGSRMEQLLNAYDRIQGRASTADQEHKRRMQEFEFRAAERAAARADRESDPNFVDLNKIREERRQHLAALFSPAIKQASELGDHERMQELTREFLNAQAKVSTGDPREMTFETPTLPRNPQSSLKYVSNALGGTDPVQVWQHAKAIIGPRIKEQMLRRGITNPQQLEQLANQSFIDYFVGKGVDPTHAATFVKTMLLDGVEL